MKYQYKGNVINYEIEGEGKPIIILHGLGQNAAAVYQGQISGWKNFETR